MKPFGVLLLVLVAVGGLFFAITQFGGDGDGNVAPVETIEPGGVSGKNPTPGGTGLAKAPEANRTQPVVQPRSDRVDNDPIQGERYDNSIRGLVINQDQQPIPEAVVVLTRGGVASALFQNESLDRSQDRRTKTDAKGAYSFANVEPSDRYSLEAKATGYSQGSLSPVLLNATGSAEQTPIVLMIGASLTGRVTDTAGNPVPGAKMHLEGLFAQLDGSPSPDSLLATTDGDGRYTIPNIPPGNRRLNISAEGFANQLKGGLVFRGEDPLLMDVTLEIAEMICGRVIDKRGSPIQGARVLAISFSNTNRQCRDVVQSDQNGEFCLSSVAAGKYTIAVNAAGYRAAHENRVATGGSGLIIELTEEGVVCGRVLAGEGAPPVPYKVQLRSTHEGTSVTSLIGEEVILSNEDGTFCIECTTSGTYRVEAVAPGYAPSFSEEFRFTQGQPMSGVLVRLSQGGSIVGRTIDAKGNPIPRPHITTHDNSWSNSLFDKALGDQFPTNVTQTAVTGDTQGRFDVARLRGETYQLRIRAAGYCEQTLRDILVVEGKRTDIGDVKLIQGGEITGSVIDQAGRPVLGATVRLDPDGKTSNPLEYRTQSGTDGKYSLGNIYPGRYKLSASLASEPFDLFGGLGVEEQNVQLVTVVDGESLRFELRIGN
jgi:protocatechuate 3,4-dioxygenase beta subunit